MDTYLLDELFRNVPIERTPELDKIFSDFIEKNKIIYLHFDATSEHFFDWLKNRNKMNFEEYCLKYIHNDIDHFFTFNPMEKIDKICEENNIPKDQTEILEDNYDRIFVIDSKIKIPKIKVDFILKLNSQKRETEVIKSMFAKKHEMKIEKNALLWLICQQGHSLSKLLHAADSESVFLRSVHEELTKFYLESPNLAVLSSIDMKDLAKAYEDNANILIPKNAVVGLFDCAHGTSSLFGIELEKDIVFPTTMIQNILIENFKDGKEVSMKKCACSVRKATDFAENAWNARASVTSEPAFKLVLKHK